MLPKMNTDMILKSMGLYDDIISIVFDFLHGTKKQVRDEYIHNIVGALDSGHNLESANMKDLAFREFIQSILTRDKQLYTIDIKHTTMDECGLSFKLFTEKNIYYELRLNKIEKRLTQFLKVFPGCFDKKAFNSKDIQRLIKVLGQNVMPLEEEGRSTSWLHCGECYNIFYECAQAKDAKVTPPSMKNFYLMLLDRNKVNRFYFPLYYSHQKILDTLPRFPRLKMQGTFYENMMMLKLTH